MWNSWKLKAGFLWAPNCPVSKSRNSLQPSVAHHDRRRVMWHTCRAFHATNLASWNHESLWSVHAGGAARSALTERHIHGTVVREVRTGLLAFFESSLRASIWFGLVTAIVMVFVTAWTGDRPSTKLDSRLPPASQMGDLRGRVTLKKLRARLHHRFASRVERIVIEIREDTLGHIRAVWRGGD